MDDAHAKWERENHERLLEWRRSYYQQNRDKQIAQATAWNEAHPEEYKRNTDKRYRRLREQAFAAYGGQKCACLGCDVTHWMALSLDHIDNDQTKYAKELGRPHTGLFLVEWLEKHDYPQGVIQVLCHNCNQSKRLNGGVCPLHPVDKA